MKLLSVAAIPALLAGVAAAASPAFASDLVDAARAGDAAAAIALIASGADANETSADGSTAILWAAHRGDEALVERLLAAGADPNVQNEFGARALQEAATAGDEALVRILLAGGAEPDATNLEGQTALMAAARAGDVETARELVAAGADVNARESWGGQTALMWAAAQHQVEMIAFLLESGADPNAQATARDWERRVTSEPRIKELHSGGFTPLLYAAREGCVACIAPLLEAGADPDLGDPDGVTPIIAALLNFRFDAAKALIEAGADVDQWDWYGRTPLFAAVDMATRPTGVRIDLPSMDATDGFEIVEMLLERGANPNYRVKLEPPYRNIAYDRGADTQVLTQGSTPLMRAAVAGDLFSVRLLIEHGADVNAVNGRGLTAAMIAAGVSRSATATRGEFVTEDEVAATLRLLAEAGAKLDVQDPRGQSALHGAALLGWSKVARTLCELGAPVTLTDARGLTPLDYASGNGLRTRGGDPGAAHPETVAVLEEFLAEERAEVPAAASGG